jgi:hypothetical protein
MMPFSPLTPPRISPNPTRVQAIVAVFFLERKKETTKRCEKVFKGKLNVKIAVEVSHLPSQKSYALGILQGVNLRLLKSGGRSFLARKNGKPFINHCPSHLSYFITADFFALSRG